MPFLIPHARRPGLSAAGFSARHRAILPLPRDPAGLPPHTTCPHSLEPFPLPRCSPLTTGRHRHRHGVRRADLVGDGVQPAAAGRCPVLEDCAGRDEALCRRCCSWFLGLDSRRAVSSAPVPTSTPPGSGSSSTSPRPLTRRACRIPSPPQRPFNPEPVYVAPPQPYGSPQSVQQLASGPIVVTVQPRFICLLLFLLLLKPTRSYWPQGTMVAMWIHWL